MRGARRRHFLKLLQKRTSNLNVFKKLNFTFLYAIWLTFDVNNANCLEVAIGSQLKIIHKIRLKKFENKSKPSRFCNNKFRLWLTV